jgi:hypothetical protein
MSMVNLVLNILETSRPPILEYDFDEVEKLEAERKKMIKFLRTESLEQTSDKNILTVTN